MHRLQTFRSYFISLSLSLSFFLFVTVSSVQRLCTAWYSLYVFPSLSPTVQRVDERGARNAGKLISSSRFVMKASRALRNGMDLLQKHGRAHARKALVRENSNSLSRASLLSQQGTVNKSKGTHAHNALVWGYFYLLKREPVLQKAHPPLLVRLEAIAECSPKRKIAATCHSQSP